MRIIGFIFFFVFVIQSVYSQEDSSRLSHEMKASNVKLAYNSSIVYPGVRMGLEIPLKSIVLSRTKRKGKQEVFLKDRFITGNVSWYHHPTFHDNVYATLGYSMRRTGDRGWFTEFSPELGYSRTFLGGTTYQVDEKGSVSVRRMAGYNYALVSLGCGLGYDLSVVQSRPFSVYYKFNVLLLFPYNSTYYIRPAMELGIIYKTAKFLRVNANQKHISKNKFKA